MARAQVLREEVARRGSSPRISPSAPEAAPVAPAFERWEGTPRDRSRLVMIVSGLPRSGTSMMMQMLAAGGIEPYTDGARAADEDNPRGYFEHHNATRLHEDASWIAGVRGKAVKIVAHLLPVLPVNYAEALEDAAGAVQRLELFLGEPFNRTLAAAPVDATLRHQRGRAER
jgi:hypothetical protein